MPKNRNRILVLGHILLALLILVAAVAIAYSLFQDRQATLDRQFQRAKANVMVFQNEVDQALQFIENATKSIPNFNDDVIHRKPNDEVQIFLKRLLHGQPAIRSISILQDGVISHSTNPSNIGTRFEVTDFKPEDTSSTTRAKLRIGHSWIGRDFDYGGWSNDDNLSQDHQPFVIPVIFRIDNDRDAKLLLVGLNPEYFLSRQERLADLTIERLQLVRIDGTVLIDTSGERKPLITPQFLDRINAEEIGADSSPNILAFRTSPKYPFFCINHIDHATALEAWSSKALLVACISSLILTALAALGSALLIKLHRYEQRLFAKREAEHLNMAKKLEDEIQLRTQELIAEQARTQELLHNMLPAKIVKELSTTGKTIPVRYDAATILFADLCDFAYASAIMPPDRMLVEINEIFAAFDNIVNECGIEKIKTIGDAYMAAAGIPEPCKDHAQRCAYAGLKMLNYITERNQSATFKWSLRIGIHSGPVVAGVVGTKRYAYDIWGDTVNIASRMESSGESMRVNTSAYTYDLIRNQFICEYRGKIDVKAKGALDMYFINGVTSESKPRQNM